MASLACSGAADKGEAGFDCAVICTGTFINMRINRAILIHRTRLRRGCY